MPWSLKYRQSVLLGCVSRFFPYTSAHLLIRAPPDLLRHLAKERRATKIFEIGESICGLEESQKDCERSTGEFSTSLHAADRKNYWLLLISVVNTICALNFRG